MNTFLKRSAALLATATAAVAMMAPTAEAGNGAFGANGGNGNASFTVQATVTASCFANVANGAVVAFTGNYTTGQTSALNGTMDIEIECPGSGSGVQAVPVQLDFTPVTPATYNMSVGGTGTGSLLPYALCDGACTGANAYGITTAGPQIPITSGAVTQSYTLGAQIAGGTAIAAGTYKQTVNGFINW